MISGTAASAFETGQFSFASSAAVEERRPPRARARFRARLSAIFVIPVPGTNVTVASTSSLSGGVPPCARPCESAIEKHAACAAAMSSSGLVSPSESSRARRPGDVERTERAALDAGDRPGALHERAGPGDVRGAIGGHQLPPSRVASTVTVAVARMRAENGQPASAAWAACGKGVGVGAGRRRSGRDVARRRSGAPLLRPRPS